MLTAISSTRPLELNCRTERRGSRRRESEEQAEMWKECVAPYTRRFAEIIRSLERPMPKGFVGALLIEVEITRTQLERLDHPDVAAARWHLLNSASDIIAAIHEKLLDNIPTAHAYLTAAQIEMEFFEIELAKAAV